MTARVIGTRHKPGPTPGGFCPHHLTRARGLHHRQRGQAYNGSPSPHARLVLTHVVGSHSTIAALTSDSLWRGFLPLRM